MANELYTLLGVEPTASAEQIRRAYFKALRVHTAEDDPTGHQAVREAWAVLSDEERRRRYDAGQRGGGEAEQLLIQGRAALSEDNPIGAVELLRRAVAIAPALEDAWQLLIRALGAADRHDEAIETAKKARSKFGGHASMLDLAEAHFRKVQSLTEGRWANVTRAHQVDLDAAARAFLDAASAMPSNALGLVGAARVAQYRKNHSEARRLAERAIAADGQVDFDDVPALRIVAMSHLAEQNVTAAAATFERICSIAPDAQEVREAVARDLVDYAVMMFKNAAFREAKMLLEPCARLAPNLDVVLELQRILERPLRCLDALERLKNDHFCHGPIIALGHWGYVVFFEEPGDQVADEAFDNIFEQLKDMPSRRIAEGLYRFRDEYPDLWELQDKIFDGLLSAACKDARMPLRPKAASAATASRPVVPVPPPKPAPPKPAPPKPAPPKPAPPKPAPPQQAPARPAPPASSTVAGASVPIAAGAPEGTARPKGAEGGSSAGVFWVLGLLLLGGLLFSQSCPSAPAPAPPDEGSAFPAAGGEGCGNGVLDSGEECDDGNTVLEPCTYGQLACQSCDQNCRLVAGEVRRCGDRLVAARLPGEGSGSGWEGCDDGNQDWLDGCDAACQFSELRCSGPDGLDSRKIDLGLSSLVGLTAGASHVCAVTASGTLACWNRSSKDSEYEPVALPEVNVALGGTDVAAIRYQLDERLESAWRYTCVVTGDESATCIWFQPKRLRDGLGPQVFDVAMHQATRISVTDGGMCASTADGMRCWRFVFEGLETKTADVEVPPGVWQDALVLPGSDGVSNVGWLCVLGYGDGRTYCRGIPRPSDGVRNDGDAAYPNAVGGALEGSGGVQPVRTVTLSQFPRSKALWYTSAGLCAVGEGRIACADGVNSAEGELAFKEARLDQGADVPGRLETSVVMPTSKGLCAIVAVTWQGDRPSYQWSCAGAVVPRDVQGMVASSSNQTCWWSGAGSPTGILTGLYSPPPVNGDWGEDAPPAGWGEGSGDMEQLLEWARRRAQEGDDPAQAKKLLNWAREQSKGE